MRPSIGKGEANMAEKPDIHTKGGLVGRVCAEFKSRKDKTEGISEAEPHAIKNREPLQSVPQWAECEKRLVLLTKRERELLNLLLEGCTLKAAASMLCVQYSTANSHMTSLYRKLEVNSRAELIIRYREASLRPAETAAKDASYAEECFHARK